MQRINSILQEGGVDLKAMTADTVRGVLNTRINGIITCLDIRRKTLQGATRSFPSIAYGTVRNHMDKSVAAAAQPSPVWSGLSCLERVLFAWPSPVRKLCLRESLLRSLPELQP